MHIGEMLKRRGGSFESFYLTGDVVAKRETFFSFVDGAFVFILRGESKLDCFMRSIKRGLKERKTAYTWNDRLILYLYLGRANNEHLRVS